MTMKTYDKLYIGGAWVKAGGTGTFDVINAPTEEVMGRVPAGTAADVDRAVKPPRARLSRAGRRQPRRARRYLQKIQAGLGARGGDRRDHRRRGRHAARAVDA